MGNGRRKKRFFIAFGEKKKKTGVHRSLGVFREIKPIPLEAEQHFSKVGSSKYGHMKFASSHLYMILHFILQVPMLSC